MQQQKPPNGKEFYSSKREQVVQTPWRTIPDVSFYLRCATRLTNKMFRYQGGFTAGSIFPSRRRLIIHS